MKLLVVEDDRASASFLEKTLKANGYFCQVCTNYAEAKEAIDKTVFDVVLLDWNLGEKETGYDLLTYIRKHDQKTAIIMLTSQDEVQAKVEALDAGADDYLTKPYSSTELLARIRVLFRRNSAQVKTSTISFGRLTLNQTDHTICLDNKALQLTQTEYDLLELFLLNPNQVLTRFQLSEHLTKDFASISGSNLIDVHIKNIRKKLGEYQIIKTVRGVGYKLEE